MTESSKKEYSLRRFTYRLFIPFAVVLVLAVVGRNIARVMFEERNVMDAEEAAEIESPVPSDSVKYSESARASKVAALTSTISALEAKIAGNQSVESALEQPMTEAKAATTELEQSGPDDWGDRLERANQAVESLASQATDELSP